MVEISLAIETKNADPPVKEAIVFELSDEHVTILRRYSAHIARLEKSQLVQSGLPQIQSVRIDKSSGLTLEISEFEYNDLCELLHLARPLLLSEEPASFEKAAGVLGKQCNSILFRKHLKNLRSMYETGDYGRYFQMSINDVPIFSDNAVKTWLNGVEYHQDEEKAAVIAKIEKALSAETTRGVFAAVLAGRIRALFSLDYFVGKTLTAIDKKLSSSPGQTFSHSELG